LPRHRNANLYARIISSGSGDLPVGQAEQWMGPGRTVSLESLDGAKAQALSLRSDWAAASDGSILPPAGASAPRVLYGRLRIRQVVVP
jgi:hypothetical protein